MKPRTQTPPPDVSHPKLGFIGAIIFTIAAVACWIYLNRDNIQEYRQTLAQRETARETIEKTKERNSLLKRRQQSLSMNGDEGEKQIRERLHMHKRGEKVIYFVNPDKTSTATIAVTEPSAGETSSPLNT